MIYHVLQMANSGLATYFNMFLDILGIFPLFITEVFLDIREQTQMILKIFRR